MKDTPNEVRENGSTHSPELSTRGKKAVEVDNRNKNIVKGGESRVTVNIINLNVNDIYFKQILKVLLQIEKLLRKKIG